MEESNSIPDGIHSSIQQTQQQINKLQENLNLLIQDRQKQNHSQQSPALDSDSSNQQHIPKIYRSYQVSSN